jgi:hypothetical protein
MFVLYCRATTPLTEAKGLSAVFRSPPLTEALSPLAVFWTSPLTEAYSLLISVSAHYQAHEA